jgi:Secretion system C-terminal sorting domain/Beta-propeller repeat
MKKYLFFLLLSAISFSQTTLQKNWSTYFLGNSSFIGDAKIDNLGNTIITGCITIVENNTYYTQFTTTNCYQSAPYGGTTDGFIAKFSPAGNLIWSTYFGGELSDTCGRIVIDDNNNFYVTGPTSSALHIATPNSYISDFIGLDSNTGFLAKFTSTGNLLWSTYIPGIIADIKLKNNEIYIVGATTNTFGLQTTAGAYHETAANYSDGGTSNYYGYFMKFDTQGSRLYATYLEKGTTSSFDFDTAGNIIFSGTMKAIPSASFLTTTGCHQANYGGGYSDGYIMKFNPSVTTKIWATFFGGNEEDGSPKLVFYNDAIYFAGKTRSSNNITTINSFQSIISNTTDNEAFIEKFTTDGVQQWGTYYGGSGYDSIGDLMIYNNKLYITGSTNSSNNIATIGSYQDTYVPTYYNSTLVYSNGFFGEFNLDGTRNWASYYNEAIGTKIISSDFNGFYLTGQTASVTGVSTAGSWQPNFNAGVTTVAGQIPYNGFISKFEFVPLSTTSFSDVNFTITPNPTKDILNINTKENIKISSISVYNTIGQLVLVDSNQNKAIDVSSLTTGNYFVKIVSSEGISNGKFIKE